MTSECHLFFEMLGTKLKISIINELKNKELNVNELAKRLNQERSKVSHALNTLHTCGFVQAKKTCKNMIYSLNKKTMLPLLNLVEKHIKKYCRHCTRR